MAAKESTQLDKTSTKFAFTNAPPTPPDSTAGDTDPDRDTEWVDEPEQTVFESLNTGPRVLASSLTGLNEALGETKYGKDYVKGTPGTDTATYENVRAIAESLTGLHKYDYKPKASDSGDKFKTDAIGAQSQKLMSVLNDLPSVATLKGQRHIQTLNSLFAPNTDAHAWKNVTEADERIWRNRSRRMRNRTRSLRSQLAKAEATVSELESSYMPHWLNSALSTAMTYAAWLRPGSWWQGDTDPSTILSTETISTGYGRSGNQKLGQKRTARSQAATRTTPSNRRSVRGFRRPTVNSALSTAGRGARTLGSSTHHTKQRNI